MPVNSIWLQDQYILIMKPLKVTFFGSICDWWIDRQSGRGLTTEWMMRLQLMKMNGWSEAQSEGIYFSGADWAISARYTLNSFNPIEVHIVCDFLPEYSLQSQIPSFLCQYVGHESCLVTRETAFLSRCLNTIFSEFETQIWEVIIINVFFSHRRS